MTRDRSFKRLVRARMDKTGESYTAARAMLLAAAEAVAPATPATHTDAPVLATSDAEIRRRTGRGWEEWFDLLDEWGADRMTHREVARRVAARWASRPSGSQPARTDGSANASNSRSAGTATVLDAVATNDPSARWPTARRPRARS